MFYDVHIPRCTHIKTNGTQCGSPALRGRRFCFFHKNWQGQRIALNVQPAAPLSFTMPVLEDADSVQVALMQVMRLLLAGQLDPKVAGLTLYALQTAALNLRQMKLEPFRRESVVIDPRSIADNGVGDDAWCAEEFEEEEEEEENDGDEEHDEACEVGNEEDDSVESPLRLRLGQTLRNMREAWGSRPTKWTTKRAKSNNKLTVWATRKAIPYSPTLRLRSGQALRKIGEGCGTRPPRVFLVNRPSVGQAAFSRASRNF